MTSVMLFVTFAHPAWAMCAVGEQLFMSCDIEDSAKSVSVCFDDHVATYRFGVKGQADELTLHAPMATFQYALWNGSARAIWETVAFQNGAYTYEIEAGFDRLFDDQTEIELPRFGSIWVTRDGQTVLELECGRQSVDYTWDTLLIEAKARLGLVWDDRGRTWVQGAE